ncbi:MAG: hypothetical protein E7267_08365 [Lachnospiraceae bacterium]|nr:hypothetical protein [Lachnospiraceae bacterium]
MRGRAVRFAVTEIQLYLVAFVIGLLLGVVFFQMKNNLIYPAMCLYQELRVDKFKRGSVASAGLLRYVAVERLKEFGFLFLTQITVFRRVAAFLCCAVCGFSCAVLEAFYVQLYGLRGLVIFFATLMPHYIFYVMAWYKLCGSGILIMQWKKELLIDVVKVFAVSIVCLFVGIICESIFNIRIIKIFL